MRIFACVGWVQPDLLQSFGDAMGDILRLSVGAQRFCNGPADAAARVERAKRVLEYHLKAAPQLTQFLCGQAVQIAALKQHLPRVRNLKRHDEPRQGRFARTTFADHAQGLSGAQRKCSPL